MKALVTGATGFIGANLVRELLADGDAVRALVRRGNNWQNLTGLWPGSDCQAAGSAGPSG